MTKREQLDDLPVNTEGVLFTDGFDEALLGIGEQFNKSVAVYDWYKCIKILMKRDGMSLEEAVEYFDYNVTGAYVGEQTPVFLHTMEQEDTMYCSYCGAEMLEGIVGAENVTDGFSLPLYTAYDSKTGKRQWVKVFRCPNSRRFFNQHSGVVINKVFVEGITYDKD